MDRTMASNLAELVIDRNAEQFLTVNGFSLGGSDYERFMRLCTCVERDPDHPLSRQLQLTLMDVFSISLPLNAQNCGEIWKITARRMLLEERNWEAIGQTSRFEILPPTMPKTAENTCFEIHSLPMEAVGWQAWKTEAEQLLSDILQQGRLPAVSFPSDFLFEKTSLYRVERHLSGEEKNPDLWSAQLLYFACDFCYQHRIRCCVDWAGDCSKLAELLRYVSKLTPISDLLLRCKHLSEETLQDICRLVMSSQTKRNEGTPPVLLIN